MTTATATSTQVYQLFIKATPEQVWDAITKSEFTTKYFYASRVEMADGRRRAYGPGGELWGVDYSKGVQLPPSEFPGPNNNPPPMPPKPAS